MWAKIFEAARKRYPIIGSGKNHFHLTYINDAVNFLLLVKNSDKARNEIFHVATKDTPTYEQVYEMICKETRTKMTEKRISVRKALLMANLYYFLCVAGGKKPSLTKRKSSIYRLVRNRWLSIKKAEKVLNFVPNYDTRKAIRETAKELKRIDLT
jgi:nucleoside-diphosphate-sugar epimerase